MTPYFTLAGGAALTLALLAGGSAPAEWAQQPERPVIRVTAERFSFTPSRITLEVGDEVEIRVTSQDTSHGFRLVGTDTAIVVPKRGAGEASVIFKAEKAGRWTFECHRLCGAGHNFMRGEIVVAAPDGKAR
jgi:cytochrome c oxidase subunit 2